MNKIKPPKSVEELEAIWAQYSPVRELPLPDGVVAEDPVGEAMNEEDERFEREYEKMGDDRPDMTTGDFRKIIFGVLLIGMFLGAGVLLALIWHADH